MKHTSPPGAHRFRRGSAAVLAAAVLTAAPVTAYASPARSATGTAARTTAAGSGTAGTGAEYAAKAAPARPAGGTAPSREQIYAALGIDQEPTDYVILVDSSGSMYSNNTYLELRPELESFLNGLRPSDHVALFTFDNHPQLWFDGAAGDTATIMSDLPPDAHKDTATDVGAALADALTELERGNAAEVASIVLLTDGGQDPPSTSSYSKDTGDEAWTALHNRAAAVAGRHELAGYALPVGDDQSGVDLLRAVVPATTELQPDGIQDLGDYLARAGERTRARKAARLLGADAGNGVTASLAVDGGRADLTDGTATAKLTLASAAQHLPLTVSGLRATVDGAPVTVSGLPSTVALAARGSRTFPVELHGRLPGGFPWYRRPKNREATLRLAGAVSSPWAPALAPDIPVKFPAAIAAARTQVPLHARVGSAALLPGVGGALLLILLLGWLRWLGTNRPRLRGELVLAPVFGGQLPDRIPLRGRRVPLRPVSVGGRGQVRGRRRTANGERRTDLLIRYTPDGTAARESGATCVPGGQVVVNGVSFTHVPADRSTLGSTTGERTR